MKNITKLQKCWIWNKSVEEFVKSKIKGYSLNACAGKSPLGDVKIDLDPKDRSVIKADMKALPFDDNTFDTVIQDPPWKIGYYDRWKPFFECVRVCKVGGTIIYNAYWIPESKIVKLKEVFFRQDGAFTNTSVIAVFEKIKHDKELIAYMK
jgi:ubiquinone/menaquinone biosynthesis C-methylase UbiE